MRMPIDAGGPGIVDDARRLGLHPPSAVTSHHPIVPSTVLISAKHFRLAVAPNPAVDIGLLRRGRPVFGQRRRADCSRPALGLLSTPWSGKSSQMCHCEVRPRCWTLSSRLTHTILAASRCARGKNGPLPLLLMHVQRGHLHKIACKLKSTAYSVHGVASPDFPPRRPASVA